MTHLRRTFLWLCSTLLVVTGVLGRGLVVCVPAGESARLEVSGDNGKCLGDSDRAGGFASVGNESAGLRGLPSHDHGCEDIALAEAPVHLPVWGSDTFLTTPSFVLSAVFPRKEAGVEVGSLPRLRRLPIPDTRSTDVYAVRTTVTLLI
jgi:hypothetical protein